MTIDVSYHGSMTEFHGRTACADPDPATPGRFILRLWDDPMGFTKHETLRRVRPESFSIKHMCIFPGATCSCGLDHDRYNRT
jgi:hypothetical protein